MRKNEVRKPGKWWTIRIRAIASYKQIAGYLICKNGHTAGHNGWSRKYKIRWDKKQRKKVRRNVGRQWDLRSPFYGRNAYRFSEWNDVLGSVRSRTVEDWVKAHEGFVEIIECEGCLILGTITSEKVAHRMFAKGTNEMMILALESI